MDAKTDAVKPRGFFSRLESLMALSALLLSVATSTLVIWDRVKPTRINLTIEPMIFAQTPFSFKANETSIVEEVDWEGYFTITNLSDRRVAINDIVPQFPIVETQGRRWELRSADKTRLLKARVYEDELTLMRSTTASNKSSELDSYFSHRGSFPFILEPGQKRHFIFDFSFAPYVDGQPARLKSDSSTKDLITALVGGYIHPKEGCHDAIAPLQLAVTLSDNKIIDRLVNTRVVVVGCVSHIANDRADEK